MGGYVVPPMGGKHVAVLMEHGFWEDVGRNVYERVFGQKGGNHTAHCVEKSYGVVNLKLLCDPPV